jgi:ribonuclease Z
MQLLVLGTGEAFDDKGLGNTSFIYSAKRQPTVLFDCGYQVPERLWQYPKIYPSIDAIYLTHLHGDHTMGLAPLFIRFLEEGRTKPLTIIGPKGVQENIEQMAVLAYASIFKKITYDLTFKEICCDQEFVFKKLIFACAHSSHSRENLSVRLWVSKTKSLAISGDGALTEATMRLFKGTDLLMHEVFSPKPAGLFHCDLEMLLDYIDESEIKKIGVTHVCRHHLKEMASLVSKQKSKTKLFMAKPGQVLKI